MLLQNSLYITLNVASLVRHLKLLFDRNYTFEKLQTYFFLFGSCKLIYKLLVAVNLFC